MDTVAQIFKHYLREAIYYVDSDHSRQYKTSYDFVKEYRSKFFLHEVINAG